VIIRRYGHSYVAYIVQAGTWKGTRLVPRPCVEFYVECDVTLTFLWSGWRLAPSNSMHVGRIESARGAEWIWFSLPPRRLE
jgi:hypothetical protein